MNAVPDDVPDGDPRFAVAKRDHVVPVAADLGLLAGGEVTAREGDPRYDREIRRQQSSLKRLRRGRDLLHLEGGASQALQSRADELVAAARGRGRGILWIRAFALDSHARRV